MVKSVYIHIPFCKNICSYCDFCKFNYNEKWVYVYLKALKSEIVDRYMNEEIETIYIGGGTPSCLTLKEIKKLLDMTKLFKTSNLKEFTFECNIEDITEELLLLLKSYKVNRLSIGIQSFNKNNLKFMQRDIDFNTAKKKILLAKSLGFQNINLDLMYAIPKETLKDLKKDLDLFLKLEPTHLSCYSLILSKHTKAYVNGASSIEEELDYEMYNYLKNNISANHYEISNYALAGYECLHNLVYWTNQEYYGFGMSASGYIDNIRYTNTSSLKDYLLGKYVKEEEILSKSDIMNYEVMLGLRLTSGINIKEFNKKYNVDFLKYYNVEPLLKSKELIKKNDYIYINPIYTYVMNEILVKLI